MFLVWVDTIQEIALGQNSALFRRYKLPALEHLSFSVRRVAKMSCCQTQFLPALLADLLRRIRITDYKISFEAFASFYRPTAVASVIRFDLQR